MTDRTTILITGVAGYWGSEVAARLTADGRYRVLGLDTRRPAGEIPGVDFILADIRNPLMVELLKAEAVDIVCHLAFRRSTRRSEPVFDSNVIGTTKLLGACASAGVRKVVLKSSTVVYGARPTNSAFLAEDHALRGSRRYGYIRDWVEIETFCNGYRHRVPELALTILRFANIVGPTASTPMTCFLSSARAPSLMGFDPMLQVIHEEDVVEALLHTLDNDIPGVFNVAAHDPLPLSKMRGIVGKPPLAVYHSVADWGTAILGTIRLQLQDYLPLEPSYLRYPWVADLTRMRDDLGFVPRYTAVEALREFAARLRLGRYRTGDNQLAKDEDQLREVIARRQRARDRQRPSPLQANGGADHG
ncbi:MAG: NAD-dependent epimerase/dehydratase family protein [Anaerolineae bacterium]|jgi:UDP-glucose 4-epimerase